MPSMSISQQSVRRTLAPAHWGSAQLAPARTRAAHAGQTNAMQHRAQLEARWRDRLESVTALSLAYHDEVQRHEAALAATGLPPGGGAESRRAKLIARQTVAERQALAEIEAALDRISAGTYGRCEQCGATIGAALLAARPQARYCGTCEFLAHQVQRRVHAAG